MECPKCKALFEEVAFAGVTVSRCTKCLGIWFDRHQHEHLKKIENSESIDIGNKKVGRLRNKFDDYLCPACASPMVRMVDPDQPHIWFESCSGCLGVYFDAGEFRDYKEKSILDFVRRLFSKERPAQG